MPLKPALGFERRADAQATTALDSRFKVHIGGVVLGNARTLV